MTLEDVYVNEKTQPILPWDELFFELEPIDDVPQSKNNVSFVFLNFFFLND